jgi:hypothetical protein
LVLVIPGTYPVSIKVLTTPVVDRLIAQSEVVRDRCDRSTGVNKVTDSPAKLCRIATRQALAS